MSLGRGTLISIVLLFCCLLAPDRAIAAVSVNPPAPQQSLHSDQTAHLDNEWFWIIMRGYFEALCVILECDPETQSSLTDSPAFTSEFQEEIESMMQQQVVIYGLESLRPNLTGTQKSRAYNDAAACAALILANPGIVSSPLEADYLAMLANMLGELD